MGWATLQHICRDLTQDLTQIQSLLLLGAYFLSLPLELGGQTLLNLPVDFTISLEGHCCISES